LPDSLKAGVENLLGYSMYDVKVHYNSDKPAQLQAYAYAQGTDIHLGPGQEKHLPYEAWHVVQQKQGKVKPTVQMKENVIINDDFELEKEADEIGRSALSTQFKKVPQIGNLPRYTLLAVVQLEAHQFDPPKRVIITKASEKGEWSKKMRQGGTVFRFISRYKNS
jgi:hypothetical protein